MKSGNLAQNTTFYTVALSLQKASAFLYFIFVARMIGVASVGKLSFAMSFTAVFGMILDFGLTQILIRESARAQTKEQEQKYLAHAVGLKLLGSLVIYSVVFALVNLMGYPEITRQMVYVSALVMICDSFTLSFYGIIRGHHNLWFESLGVIFNQVLIIIFGALVLLSNLGLVALVGVYLISSGFNLLYSAWLLRKKLGLSLWPRFNIGIFKEVLKLALPFAIAGVFVKLYSAMDIILLSKMASEQAVGLYSVAYKVAFALQFVGLASLASIYPAFSSYFVHSKELLARTFERVVFYMLLFSLPLAFGVISVASYVIIPVFGARYEGAIPSLQILMLCIPFAFLCFPAGAMLNASNKQTTNTFILAVTAIANIILNLILIPYYSLIGSAVAAVISYLIMFGLSIIFINKIVKINFPGLAFSLMKILAACVLMTVAVLLLITKIHFVIAILAGVLVYGLMIFATRALTLGEIRASIKLIRQKPV